MLLAATRARRSYGSLAALILAAVTSAAWGAARRFPDLPDPAFHFRTFIAAWGGTTNAEFRRFLRDARPEIVQVGFYGPMFHGYADNPLATGYPMQLPVTGQRQALAVQKQVNAAIHAAGRKAVGHFQMVNAIVTPGHTNDFLDFYARRWPTDLLGARPHTNVAELLQRDAEGNIKTVSHYVDYVGMCWNSPYARHMLKQMLKLALASGLDGIMVNYNYHWGCVCPYCQAAFKAHLSRRFTPDQLRAKFGIADLAAQRFARIAAEIPGYPAIQAAPLDWEAMRWGAEEFKRAFDEIFIEYGRKLKPDLIVATWNHLGDMSIGEERAFTPLPLWGRGENYFWYSGGYGPSDLAQHKAGDGWLDCLYIRELCGGKPFMLGKYENIRMRSSLAEGWATGGSGMGLSMVINDPVGYTNCAAYLRFVHDHQALYAVRDQYAETALVFPRQALQNGARSAGDVFKAVGKELIDRHALMDVVADQKLTLERLRAYRLVVLPETAALTDYQCAALSRFVKDGGRALAIGPAAATDADGTPRSPARLWGSACPTDGRLTGSWGSGSFVWAAAAATNAWQEGLTALAGEYLSRIEGPWTVRVAAYADTRRLVLHWVNFNRDEAGAKGLAGPRAECPLPATGIAVKLRLSEGIRVDGARWHSPDRADHGELSFRQEGQEVAFTLPDLLVYGLVELAWR